MRRILKLHNPLFARTMHRWHRRVGLAAILFMLLLIFTGVPLHHSARLGLDQSNVEIEWLLDVYGIDAPASLTTFALKLNQAPELNITQIDDSIYFNQSKTSLITRNNLVGVSRHEIGIILFFQSYWELVSADGELIETVEWQKQTSLPIESVCLTGESPIILTNNAAYSIDPLMETEQQESSCDTWQTQTVLDKSLQQALNFIHRSHSLSWERVLLDLHSGVLFGTYGPWVMDLAALLMLILAFSGLWMWYRKLGMKV